MTNTAIGDAPGRVNLLGEHTDYHDGYVLPTTIPQRTRVHLTRRDDTRVRATTAIDPGNTREYRLGFEVAGRDWLDYVQGVTATLARHGRTLPGFDLVVESTVPVGAGVSSSAALEVALLRGLRALMDLPLDDRALAMLAHEAETRFVGVPVGLLDQLASSLGRDDDALFVDLRTLTVTPVPLPPTIDLAVIHSGITHAHTSGGYVDRRRESFEAAALLGVERLGELSLADLPRLAQRPGVPARRARHVITENARVVAAANALSAGDGPQLGRLFVESHASMRDDYEVSTPEIDALVQLAGAHPDVFGARLTGGGFGGAIVVVTRAGAGAAVAAAIDEQARARLGLSPQILMPPAFQNAPDA